MLPSDLAIIMVPASAQVVESFLLARRLEEAGFKTEMKAGPTATVTLGIGDGAPLTYDDALQFLRTYEAERRSVSFKRIRSDAILPAAGSVNAAGLDLHACIDAPFSLRPGESRLVPTGWAFECPPGTYGRIAPRSGMSMKGFVVNAGVIDSDFRGEVQVLLAFMGGTESSVAVHHGDRVAQLIFERFESVQAIETTELSESERGAGGWGSTGT